MESRQQPQVPVYREANRFGEPVPGKSREREHVLTSLTRSSPIVSAVVDSIRCARAAASNKPIETDLRKRALPACSAAHGRRWAAANMRIHIRSLVARSLAA